MTTNQSPVVTGPLYGDGDDQFANIFPHERYLAAVAAPAIVTKLTPTQKREARRQLARFFAVAETNRDRISYTQERPFDPTVNPAVGFRGDCSSYVTQAFEYVRNQDDIPLHDPNGVVEHDGWGFTGTLLATNHAHVVPRDHKHYVGDLALCGTFWRTVHVSVCSKDGTAATSEWSSHGSSAGPLKVRLDYRPDVLVVLRPVSLL